MDQFLIVLGVLAAAALLRVVFGFPGRSECVVWIGQILASMGQFVASMWQWESRRPPAEAAGRGSRGGSVEVLLPRLSRNRFRRGDDRMNIPSAYADGHARASAIDKERAGGELRFVKLF